MKHPKLALVCVVASIAKASRLTRVMDAAGEILVGNGTSESVENVFVTEVSQNLMLEMDPDKPVIPENFQQCSEASNQTIERQENPEVRLAACDDWEIVHDQSTWEAKLNLSINDGDLGCFLSLMRTSVYENFMTHKNLNGALAAACYNGKEGIVLTLLKRDEFGSFLFNGIDPSVKDYECLQSACKQGHLSVVEILLQQFGGKFILPGMAGVSLDNALDSAARNNHPEIVKLLVRLAFDNHVALDPKRLHLLLFRACNRGDETMAAILLERNKLGHYICQGIDPSFRDYECLESACEEGHLSVVMLLLQRFNGQFVLPGMSGVTLARSLNYAALRSHIDVVTFLKRVASDCGGM